MRITRYFSQNIKECMEGIHTGSWHYLDWHQRTNQQTSNISTILGCNLICATIFNFQSDPKLKFCYVNECTLYGVTGVMYVS